MKKLKNYTVIAAMTHFLSFSFLATFSLDLYGKDFGQLTTDHCEKIFAGLLLVGIDVQPGGKRLAPPETVDIIKNSELPQKFHITYSSGALNLLAWLTALNLTVEDASPGGFEPITDVKKFAVTLHTPDDKLTLLGALIVIEEFGFSPKIDEIPDSSSATHAISLGRLATIAADGKIDREMRILITNHVGGGSYKEFYDLFAREIGNERAVSLLTDFYIPNQTASYNSFNFIEFVRRRGLYDELSKILQSIESKQ